MTVESTWRHTPTHTHTHTHTVGNGNRKTSRGLAKTYIVIKARESIEIEDKKSSDADQLCDSIRDQILPTVKYYLSRCWSLLETHCLLLKPLYELITANFS
jgi:hypothetical protein